MASWLSALRKTREVVAGAFRKAFGAGRADAETREQLEETLLRADLSPALVAEVLGHLEDTRRGEDAPAERMASLLESWLPESTFDWKAGERPRTLLVVGVNGSGKTTTCAKLARLVQRQGLTPILCAGDTFRAAGSDQLRIWADRVGCEVVYGASGADAAAVAFDGLSAALARKADALIVDTAGRMHTRTPLMDELKKVRRSMAKRLERAPDETWIVLDAALGRNAIAQARAFHDAVPLTGVIVSKLDGSSRAGFVYSIAREMNVPIRYAGLGEQPDDLTPFDRTAFTRALLGLDGEGA